MLAQYRLLYVLLGICMGLLVLVAYRLYRQHAAKMKHSGSLHRSRRWGRRSHRHDQP